jgi:hypothetical protein
VAGSQGLYNIDRIEGTQKNANRTYDNESISFDIDVENNQLKSVIMFLNESNDHNAMNRGRVCFVLYMTSLDGIV